MVKIKNKSNGIPSTPGDLKCAEPGPEPEGLFK